MGLKTRSLKHLILPALALIPAQALALRTNPTVIEVGDSGNISIPFGNREGGINPVENVRLAVTSAPAWVDIDAAASFMGPATIYPGESMTFNASYKINPLYDPDSPLGSMILDLLSDSASFVPSGITWSFVTDNGFKTMRGECVENDGVGCGSYLSPDTLAPNTYLQFDGPFYEDNTNNIFLATYTLVNFIGSDAYESNAEISRAAIIGYAIGAPALSFEALNFSTTPVLLSAGQNSLYFASRDYAGNTEAVKSSAVYVDGTAPQTSLSVEGFSSADGRGALVVSTGAYIVLAGTDSAAGLSEIRYSIDGADHLSYAAGFQLEPGTHTVSYFGMDHVGNLEVIKTSTITVDDAPPVTTASLDGTRGQNDWYISPVALTLVSTDALSGIKDIMYSLSGADYVAYTQPVVVSSDGNHIISYYAEDMAGNRESIKAIEFAIDTTSVAVMVKLKLEPETLNLGSKGEDITARLKVEGKACFSRSGININAINGHDLESPIYAMGAKDKHDEERGRDGRGHDDRTDGDKDRGNGHSGHGGDDDDSRCGAITVKFDRADVIAVLSSFAPEPSSGASKGHGPAKLLLSEADLPGNAKVKVTVSGKFTDGRSFSADDTIRTIKPAADPAFRLGAIHVSPNPAKGGKAPVFHIETGIADRVKIIIRTVSGMVTHEHAITGMPQVLDKGGDPVYAYEYAWEGRIAGGIYHYTIEAEKAGQKHKNNGMFAVIR